MSFKYTKTCLKNGPNILYFLYTGSHKSLLIHYGLWEEIFQSVLYQTYTALNVTKLTYVFNVYNSMFHIQDHTKDFG